MEQEAHWAPWEHKAIQSYYKNIEAHPQYQATGQILGNQNICLVPAGVFVLIEKQRTASLIAFGANLENKMQNMWHFQARITPRL